MRCAHKEERMLQLQAKMHVCQAKTVESQSVCWQNEVIYIYAWDNKQTNKQTMIKPTDVKISTTITQYQFRQCIPMRHVVVVVVVVVVGGGGGGGRRGEKVVFCKERVCTLYRNRLHHPNVPLQSWLSFVTDDIFHDEAFRIWQKAHACLHACMHAYIGAGTMNLQLDHRMHIKIHLLGKELGHCFVFLWKKQSRHQDTQQKSHSHTHTHTHYIPCTTCITTRKMICLCELKIVLAWCFNSQKDPIVYALPTRLFVRMGE